jgi:hemerythrin-like domain-containing protein
MRRREFLIAAGLPTALSAAALASKPKKKEPEEIGPVEDLMREHGILRRILLVYDEVARRLRAGQKTDLGPTLHAAQLVREFIEDYHERNEEQFIFPRFEQSGRLAELVSTLRAQHQEGRRLTDQILQQNRILPSLESFNRMYRAHAAFEDTVLFPSIYRVWNARELAEMGEKFEQIEHSLPRDFEKALAEVAAIERAYEIADLSKYTPA